MGRNPLGEGKRHDSGDLLNAGGPQLRDAAKALQQPLCHAWAYARNVLEARPNRALRSALAMESYGEAVSLVADLLDQMKDR